MTTLRTEIDYPGDGAHAFQPIAAHPWAVFLDSCGSSYSTSRYDILAAEPYCTVTTRGAVTEIRGAGGALRCSRDDPFDILRDLVPAAGAGSGLPFEGGAIGYFGYDLGRRIEQLPSRARDDLRLPDMAVGLYDMAMVIDHGEQRAWLVGVTEERWDAIATQGPRVAAQNFQVLAPLRCDMDRRRYAHAFARIKEYICAGDCYQVNLARRFSVPIAGHPWSVYKHLRGCNPAPFAAFLNVPGATVLSLSPERFLKVHGRRVETRPIKGTRPRSQDLGRDRRLSEELRRSEKDRAENLMIVDLLRNDLGKTCATGSVRVPRLFEIEHYPTVHHLVSTVTGELPRGTHVTELLRGCFPGGSVTGAPKLRAMQIIEELEPHRRGVYCGAIGYLGANGRLDTNIAIRTMVHRHDTVHFWAGGGIVADSQLDAEFDEILHKAQAMLALLGEPTRVAQAGA
jgi:para-aminobenzoate synthetase component 1